MSSVLQGFIVFVLIVAVSVGILCLTCQHTETIDLEEIPPTDQLKGITEEYRNG